MRTNPKLKLRRNTKNTQNTYKTNTEHKLSSHKEDSKQNNKKTHIINEKTRISTNHSNTCTYIQLIPHTYTQTHTHRERERDR